MLLTQASVLALAVSLAQASTTELLWSRVESSTCGTQAVTASIAALEAGTAYPIQFCQFYTSGHRVRSPFTDIPVSALRIACRCILADVTSTSLSSEVSSTTTSSQAAATSASSTPIKTVKSTYNDYTSFCTFYIAYPRSESTIPDLSAAQVEKACKSILASKSTSSLASTTKSALTRSSTVSASSTSKISSKVSSTSSTSKTLSKASSPPSDSKTSFETTSKSSTSKTSTKVFTTSTPSRAISRTSSATTSGSTTPSISSSVPTSLSALSTATPFYLVAENVAGMIGGIVLDGATVETLASALNSPIGFNRPQPASGWVQHNYTIDSTTGYIYDRFLLVGAGLADGASSGTPLSIEAGNADFAPLICAVPVGGSALACNVTYEDVIYTQFLVTCCSSPTLYIGDDTASSSYSSLDLQVIYESTPTSSTSTSTSATPTPTYYLLAANAGDYLSGNQALAAEISNTTSQPGFNFPYFEPASTQYYTFTSTGYIYNNASLRMGASVDSGTDYLPIYPYSGDSDSTLTPLICITPNASSLLNCSVTYNSIVYSQFVLEDATSGGELLGLSQRGNVPSGYSTLDLQAISDSVAYTPGSGDQ